MTKNKLTLSGFWIFVHSVFDEEMAKNTGITFEYAIEIAEERWEVCKMFAYYYLYGQL